MTDDERRASAATGPGPSASDTSASRDSLPVVMVVDGDDQGVGDEPAPGTTRPGLGLRAWTMAVALVALGVAGVTAWSTQRPDQPDLPAAPTGVVAQRWSVVVDGSPAMAGGSASASTTQTSVSIADGWVLNTIRSEIGRVLAIEKRAVSTGELIWRRQIDQFDVPVVVDAPVAAHDPRGQWLPNAGSEGQLVGVSFEDGTVSWERPIGPDFLAWVGPEGGLFASGNGLCGFIESSSGDFVFLREAQRCAPAAAGLALRDDEAWAVYDDRGQAIGGRTPVSGPVPRVVGDVVVSARGETVTATGRGDRVLWSTGVGSRVDVLGQRPTGPDHIAVWAGDQQFVFDVVTGTRFGPFPPTSVPFLLDGELRVLDDGSSPLPDLVASGVWSRSPDANTVRMLDARGRVVARRDIVLAQPHVLTTEGVLLWEQVGVDSTLGLYGYDDLQPLWQIDVDGQPTAGLASAGDWVVASYVDREGDTRLVGVDPHDADERAMK